MPQLPDRVPPPGVARILQKYLNQQCTEAEKQLVDNWYAGLGEDMALETNNEELDLQEERLWQKIELTSVKASPPIKIRALNSWTNYHSLGSVAAAVVLVVGLFWLLGLNAGQDEYNRSEKAFSIVENNRPIDHLVKLPDGSLITLKPAGKLRYSYQDSHKREIFLTGEAFFQVAKNVNRPFLVHTGKVVTRVLGTSFSIKYEADKSQAVEVQVKTGKVAVSQREIAGENLTHKELAKPQVVLTPNQKVVFNPVREQFKVDLVKTPAIINKVKPAPNLFLFRETSLAVVAQTLEKAYGIRLILSESLKHCPLTADLSEEKFYAKLDLICEALQAEYKIRGTRIYLTGKGCQSN